MTVIFENENSKDYGFDFDFLKQAELVIDKALDLENFPYEVQVGLTLTDDAGIQEINKNLREIDSPTDVLSFPLLAYEKAADFSFLEDDNIDCVDPDSGEITLGDIVINLDRVLSQANEYGHSPLREYSFLIAHSMMHLFGYDHMTPEDEELMLPHQNKVLDELGITR